jgi:segregation and condensation protein B
MELIKIVEALLFSYQEPLSVELMGRAVRETAKEIVEAGNGDEVTDAAPLATVTDEQIAQTLQDLIASYDRDGRAFTVVERGTGWRLCARVDYAEWCRSLYPGKKPQRLSQPALETLAIIAYRQPITKAGIEAVRGVSVDAMVQQLLDRGLVKAEGRAELPGKPMLYGTTENFLEHFAIRNIDDLPNAQELRRVKLPSAEADTGTPPAEPPQQMTLGAVEPELPVNPE